jgi:LPXTG-site transpeptidase (sortase) family protein
MNFRSRSTSTLRLAGVLALVLSFAAGVPGLSTGPLGSSPVVSSVQGVTYSRVSSLNGPTRASNLAVPRLGIRLPIKNGVIGAAISRRYAYHYPSTSWPGGHSNSYFYAHAQTGAFVNLKNIRKGDLVTLRLVNGKTVKYKVTAKYSVAWNDGRWVMPTSSERISLQTCLGPSKTSRRLIVIAVPAY